MIITFATVALCAGPVRTVGSPAGVMALSIDDNPTIQITKPVRATRATPLARKNNIVSISFDVEIEHATVATAETYVMSHYESLSASGSLVVGTKTFAGAVLGKNVHKYSGVKTHHHYEFVAKGNTTA